MKINKTGPSNKAIHNNASFPLYLAYSDENGEEEEEEDDYKSI